MILPVFTSGSPLIWLITAVEARRAVRLAQKRAADSLDYKP
jgi:hypothetical protein